MTVESAPNFAILKVKGGEVQKVGAKNFWVDEGQRTSEAYLNPSMEAELVRREEGPLPFKE